jgi:hypothetical protein
MFEEKGILSTQMGSNTILSETISDNQPEEEQYN